MPEQFMTLKNIYNVYHFLHTIRYDFEFTFPRDQESPNHILDTLQKVNCVKPNKRNLQFPE